MKTIFKDYLDIFLKFSKDRYLTKKQRKERYDLLQEYEKKNFKMIIFILFITKYWKKSQIIYLQ